MNNFIIIEENFLTKQRYIKFPSLNIKNRKDAKELLKSLASYLAKDKPEFAIIFKNGESFIWEESRYYIKEIPAYPLH